MGVRLPRISLLHLSPKYTLLSVDLHVVGRWRKSVASAARVAVSTVRSSPARRAASHGPYPNLPAESAITSVIQHLLLRIQHRSQAQRLPLPPQLRPLHHPQSLQLQHKPPLPLTQFLLLNLMHNLYTTSGRLLRLRSRSQIDSNTSHGGRRWRSHRLDWCSELCEVG